MGQLYVGGDDLDNLPKDRPCRAFVLLFNMWLISFFGYGSLTYCSAVSLPIVVGKCCPETLAQSERMQHFFGFAELVDEEGDDDVVQSSTSSGDSDIKDVGEKTQNKKFCWSSAISSKTFISCFLPLVPSTEMLCQLFLVKYQCFWYGSSWTSCIFWVVPSRPSERSLLVHGWVVTVEYCCGEQYLCAFCQRKQICLC